MMHTIALIGTSHIYQTQSPRCSPEDAEAFQRFLLEACLQYDIRTVAEELNTQALEMTREAWEANKKELERRKKKGDWIKREIEKKIEEGLERSKEGMSIPQRVAAKRSLKSLFCDPDGEQRALHGIKEDDKAKRERYWLNRLRQDVPQSEWPVLFICGATHVKSFSKILEEEGFIVTRIEDDWEP